MKTDGKGNELTVYLEPGEIPALLSRELSTTARMRDYEDRRHDIPFVLSVADGDDIIVVTEPRNSYLPESQLISVYLSIEKYAILLENGLTGTRFGAGGKITLRDRTVKNYL